MKILFPAPTVSAAVFFASCFALGGCGALTGSQRDEDMATIQRMGAEENARAERERQARQADAARRSKERQDAEDQARADKASEERTRLSALEAECSPDRAERLKDLKVQVGDFLADVKVMAKNEAWLAKHCERVDTRGVLVQRERTSSGVVVRTKEVGEEEEAKCNAKRPPGVTQELVELYLQMAAGERIGVYNGEYLQKNTICREADSAAGIDFFVTVGDADGVKAIASK